MYTRSTPAPSSQSCFQPCASSFWWVGFQRDAIVVTAGLWCLVTLFSDQFLQLCLDACHVANLQISWLVPLLLVVSMRQFNSQVCMLSCMHVPSHVLYPGTSSSSMQASIEAIETSAVQMAAAQAQQRAASAQQTTRRNPFDGSPWGGSPFGGSPFTPQGRGRPSAGNKPGPDFTQQPGGPVIDAEFETIDDGDH